MSDSSLPPSTRKAILRKFRWAYGVLVICLAGLSALALAWHWSLPKPWATGFAIGQAFLVLLGAALFINALSFYVQDRYVRRLLKRPGIATDFSVSQFGLRFYGYNLAIALLFALIGFYPWMLIVFFFAYYPIILWLLPYHLPMGWLLGWLIQRQLPQYP